MITKITLQLLWLPCLWWCKYLRNKMLRNDIKNEFFQSINLCAKNFLKSKQMLYAYANQSAATTPDHRERRAALNRSEAAHCQLMHITYLVLHNCFYPSTIYQLRLTISVHQTEILHCTSIYNIHYRLSISY